MGKIIGAILSVLEIVVGVLTFQPELVVLGAVSLAGILLAPGLPKPPSSETTVKNPVPARVSGYGTMRLYMNLAIWETSDNFGQTVDVGAVHDGRIDGIVQRFLNDKRVTFDSGTVIAGLDDGAFGGQDVNFYSNLGDAPNAAFSPILAMLPGVYTAAHRGDGVAMLALTKDPAKSKNLTKRYPQGDNVQASIAARLQWVFDWRDESQDVTDPSTWKWSENAVLHLAHYKLIREGARPQLPMVVDSGGTPIINPAYVAELAGILSAKWARLFAPTLAYWTAAADDADVAMPLKGLQTILTTKADSGDHSIEVTSVDGLSVGMSMIVDKTGNIADSETVIVTSISGLTIHFTPGFGHKHPQGAQVTWSSDPDSPPTEARYRSCVVHKHTDKHADVIGTITACFDGWVSARADGALVVYTGRYYEPTVTIGPDEIVSHSTQFFVEDENSVNEMVVSYVSANHDWATVQCDPWRDEDDIARRGVVMSQPFDNPVPSFSQQRRLAKRKMARAMAPRRGTITTNSQGRAALTERFVNLDITEAGATFYSGPAEITKLTRNFSTGGVTFEWVSADANIDDWIPATEEGLPAAVGNRVASAPLDTPVITSATPETGYDSASGNAGAFITLTVDAPDRADLIWFARTRVAGAPVWGERQYSDIDAGASVTLVTEFVPVDQNIEVEVAYQVGDGRVSDWSATSTVDTSTAGVAPGPVTSLAAADGTGESTISYRNPSSANFNHVRLYYGSTAVFGSATAFSPDQTGGLGAARSVSITPLAAGTWYFWARPFNAGGTGGTIAGPVSATVS